MSLLPDIGLLKYSGLISASIDDNLYCIGAGFSAADLAHSRKLSVDPAVKSPDGALPPI